MKRNRLSRGFLNSLDYFNEHPELHNLSRRQLAKSDCGLYRTLLRSRDLEKAIPEVHEKGGKLSEREIEEIKENYILFNGNVSQISRKLGYSLPTIHKYLRLEEDLR